MARARNIKPGFFANEELVELPFEYRLLFIGLWTLADREGRLEDRPKRIRMAIFPADNVDVDKGLTALAAAGFVERYEAEGYGPCILIPNFLKHQNPHHKEPPSTIPPPDSTSSDKRAARGKQAMHEGKTQGSGAMHEPKARGKPKAAPPSQGGQTVLIPDSGFLIPDSLNDDGSVSKTPARATPAVVVEGNPSDPDPPDPPPPRLPTDPIGARALELSVLLRARGARLQHHEPTVRAWAERGVTDAQALAALDQANAQRADKADPTPVNAGYLNAILATASTPGATHGSTRFSPARYTAQRLAEALGVEAEREAAGDLRDAVPKPVRLAGGNR